MNRRSVSNAPPTRRRVTWADYPLRAVVGEVYRQMEMLECGHQHMVDCYEMDRPAKRRRCRECWIEAQQVRAALGRRWELPMTPVLGVAFPVLDGWDYAGAFALHRSDAILLRDRAVRHGVDAYGQKVWVRHGVAFDEGEFATVIQFLTGREARNGPQCSVSARSKQDDALAVMRQAEANERWSRNVTNRDWGTFPRPAQRP